MLYRLHAQCSSIDFIAPAQVCIGSNFLIQNNTTASSFEWDLCPFDLTVSPKINSAGTFSSFTSILDLTLIDDNGDSYGFTINPNTNSLIKIHFSSGIDTSPTFSELGNINGLLNFPNAISMVQEAGNWFGIIANAGDNNIILLNFGTSPENVPTASVLFTRGGGGFVSLDIATISSSSHTLVIGEYNSKQVTIVNYPQGFLTSSNFNTQTVSVGTATPIDVQVVQQCGNWYVFTLSFDERKLYRLDFGSSLLSVATVTPYSLVFGFDAYRLSVVREGDMYHTFVSNISSGGISRLDFGSDITAQPAITDLGTLGVLSNSRDMWIGQISGQWRGFLINLSDFTLYRLTFQFDCGATPAYSQGTEPGVVNYSHSGSQKIVLTAIQSNGSISFQPANITVTTTIAPTFTISSQNSCVGHDISFSASNTSIPISSYSWAFGDGNTSSSPSPVNIYAATGTYQATLETVFSNTCSNLQQANVQVYNVPQSGFSSPTPALTCSNQAYTFTNTSTSDAGSNPTWQWTVNGNDVSTSKDLVQSFSTVAAQSIQLTASIPGCSSTSPAQNFTIQQQGPLTDFAITGNCQSDVIQFTNQTNTSGTTISSYAWTFGDNNTSSATDAQNTYSAIGTYDVTLVANNTIGCSNSATKSLTIYTKPQPDFSLDLPPFSCNGSLSQFHDLTPAPTDSNISGWSWNFGDGTDVLGDTKNPTYTYTAAGNYTVSFTATSNFGCSNTIQKSVTISQSPVAAFTNTTACVNQAVQFTDTSTGSIKARQWKIQNTIYTAPNPSITFNVAGTYPIQLTETGNNNCVNILSKNIIVPVPPTLDFGVVAPCVDNTTVFTESNPGGSDPSASWTWDFGGQGTDIGSPAQFAFSSTGIYSVKMTSTRQSGCVYSISKSVSVGDSPKASFTASVTSGPAPLDVSFNNTSSLADSYLWQFKDKNNTTSADPSPSFTYNDLGTYQVSLTASNVVGCSSSYFLPIYVVIPQLDLSLKDFYFVKDPASGSLKAVVTVLNKSNLPITNPEIMLDLSGVGSIKGNLSGTLLPNQSLVQTLGFDIVPMTAQYACAEVDLTGDIDLADNRRCVSLTGEEVLFTPYPNPAQTQITMQWISTDGQDVRVTIYNATGEVTYDQFIAAPSTGLNQLQINTSLFAAGIYFMQFSDANNKQTYRFAISGN